MSYNWSQLRPLSKLEQLAETIMKTGFLLSENHHVFQINDAKTQPIY